MLKRVVAIALILIMVFELRVVTSLAQDNDSNNFKNEKNQEYDYLSIPVSLFGGKSNNEELMIYNGYVYADIKELSNKLGLVYNSYDEYSDTKGENDQNKLILEFKKGYAESFSDADPSSLEIRIRKQNSSLVFYFRPGSQNAFAYSIYFGKYCYNMGSPVLVSKGKTWVPLASFLFLFDSYCYVDEEKLNIGRSALTVIDILHRVDLENYHFDIVDQYGEKKWVFLAKTGYSDYYKRVKNFVSGGLSFDIEKMRKTVTYDDVADVLSLQLYTANTSEIESIQDEYKDIGLVSDATVALSDSLVELSETISTGTLNDAETYISYFDHLMDNNYYCTIADIQRAGKQASQVVQKSSNASAINNIMSSSGKVITYGAAAFSVYLSYITYINEIDSANKNYIPAVQKYIDYYSNTNTNGLSRDLMELIRKKGDLYKNSKNVFDNEELLSAISSSIANNAIKLKAGLAIAPVLPTVIGAGLIATIGWDVSETIVNHISGAAFTHIDSAENTFFAMKLESDTERTLESYKYSIMYENAYDFDTYRYLEWVRLKSYCIAREDAIQYSQRLLKKYPNEIGDVISRWRSEESVLNNLMSVLISGTHEGITPEKIKQASKKTDAMNLEIGDQVKQLNQKIKSEGSYYLQVILEKMKEYGSLRIVHNNGDWENEANGLCYLNLIDFTGDGEDELFAVCKSEDEKHYTGYIYTLSNGTAEPIYENSEIEYNFFQGFDILYLGYSKDNGFVFGTGWEDDGADDRTFFLYKNGEFRPVYRSKGYYDGNLGKKVVEDQNIEVDIFKNQTFKELQDGFGDITLRTKSNIDINGDYYDSSKLRKSVDDVIRRLNVSPAELPPELGLPGMDAIADAEIYFCWENKIDQWKASVENNKDFWSIIGIYGNSEPRIEDLNPTITGDDGDAFILDKSIIENAAYASFSDFSGSLPEFKSYPDMYLIREVSEDTVTLGYGEPGVMTERKSYVVNDDKSLDVIYTASYFQDDIEPIADYSVHMELNQNYNKCNDYFTYYYTVTGVKKLKEETKLNELSKPTIYHCIEKGLNEWIPEKEDKETFWDVMCFYCNFTDRINTIDYPRMGEYEEYNIIPNDLLENVAYAFYKDFDGNLPTIEDNIWRAQNCDEKSTGIAIGDTSPIIITSEKYQHNKDGTIEAEYETEYTATGTPSGSYKVHFEPNLNYNKVSSEEPYSFGVSYVERLDKSATVKNNESKELSMEEFRIPYGHFFGGKSQGEGVLGIDIDLYEDSSFSIESAFDPFTGDNGDAYSFAGTFKVDQVNNDGNPVLHFHCDEGDLELVWDGEYLKNDAFNVWYEGE